MATTTQNCPACGGAVALANRFVKMIVCPYCGNSLAVENDRLDLTGQKAALADMPSRFRIQMTGKLKGEKFRILGRVRFDSEDNYWDEWYLEFADGSIAWLEEEEGLYSLSRPQKITSEVPKYDEVRVGSSMTVNGERFFVTERCQATVAGAEGQLYFRVKVGSPVQFVDGNLGGRLAALEYAGESIEFTLGEPIDRKSVELDEGS